MASRRAFDNGDFLQGRRQNTVWLATDCMHGNTHNRTIVLFLIHLEENLNGYSIDLVRPRGLVTGASSGLGAQFARTLARAGAGVVLASRRMEKLKELRARIEGEGGDAHVVELDVTDHDSIKAAVAHAETEMGSIDILVNNSGVSTTQRIQDVT
jgi:NADPH:quinone reductase-like Zn-dependent oxidoreductase